LKGAGCSRVFTEKASGKREDRTELKRCLDYLRPGDTLVVAELSRLGRSMKHLVATVESLAGRGVEFRSLKENVDTSGASGKLVFGVFCAISQFERDLIAERTREGIEAAKRRGAKVGRKATFTPDLKEKAAKMRAGGMTVAEVCQTLGVGRATYYRSFGA
jgi:DNA invertase Pin-like site-specific DNA recombinase